MNVATTIIIFQVFSGMAKKVLENFEVSRIFWYICKTRDEWNVARGHSQKTRKFCMYNNLSTVNEVRKCMFTSKYKKRMLPKRQEKDMRRANFVATTSNSANMLQIDLDSRLAWLGWESCTCVEEYSIRKRYIWYGYHDGQT